MSETEFFKIKPWAHQLEGMKRATKDPDGFGFFFEVGAGKTMTCINTLRYQYKKEGRVKKTLILGPSIVLENWKREFAVHSNIPQDIIHVLSGPGKKRIAKVTELMNESCIFITNYEALSRMPDIVKAFLKWSPEILVLDESHRCKSKESKQTKAAIKISDKAEYKYLLSGTPVLNSMLDLWAQFRIMDGGKTFGKKFFDYRNKYFRDLSAGMSRDKYFPNWVARKDKIQEVNELVRSKSMHVSKDECLDLPPLVKKTIPVEMSPEQRKAYAQMQKDLIAFMNDKACVAELAITRALRLQQIVTGHIPLEDKEGKVKIQQFKKNPRKDALKELLSDIISKHKVLVWAVFKENYKDIREVCEALKIKYVEVHGDKSHDEKMSAVDLFNTDESVRLLIGHPGSGGIGINLVASDVSIFYSRNFSLEYDIQAEARNYRGGSERHAKVTRIDLVTPGTIDEQVLNALASKKKIGYQVIQQAVLS